MNRIVILVSGGVVQSVCADDPAGLEAVLIDEDNIEAGDPDPREEDASLAVLLDTEEKALL